MKNFVFVNILLLIVMAFLFAGCSRLTTKSSVDDSKIPASIGEFKRGMVYNEKEQDYTNEKNKNQKYKSIDARYSDGSTEAYYRIGTHQTAENAMNEQKDDCAHGKNNLWKSVDLKDKSGKAIGKISICRINDYSPNSPNAANGGFDYSVAFNIDNQSYSTAFINASSSWTPQTTDKFVDFVKALPPASQVDLSILDTITTSFTAKGVTAEKIAAITPPVKTVSAPYLKGKTAVAVTGNYSTGVRTEDYIKDAAAQANLMEEVGSIVKVDCAKGSSIGQYSTDKGVKIPAFSSVCKVSIIDNTIPAVIAQKSFSNSTMLDNIMVDADKDGKLYNYNKEYVAPYPTREIAEYLEKLPKKP